MDASALLSSARVVPVVVLDDPDFAHLAASASDKEWLRGLLADSTARDAILRLTRDTNPVETRSLGFRAGLIVLSVNHTSVGMITEDNVREWFDGMQAVLEVQG